MPRPKTIAAETVSVTFEFGADDLRRLDSHTQGSRSWLIRKIIAEWLDLQDQKNGGNN